MYIGAEYLRLNAPAIKADKFRPVMRSMHASVESLNALVDEINEAKDVSKEGLMDFLVGILDGAVGVTKNIASIIARGGDRSELRYWYDQNMIATKRIENESIAAHRNLLVDYPTGMITGYKPVVEAIEEVYAKINLIEHAGNCLKLSDAILISMSRGATEHEELLAQAIRKLDPIITETNKRTAALDNMFNQKGISADKREFGKLVNSFTELKDIRERLLALEPNLIAIKKVEPLMADADKSVRLAIDFIHKTQSNGGDLAPSKIFIRDYSLYIRNIAVLADAYANCSTKQLAVEHNLVLDYVAVLDNKA